MEVFRRLKAYLLALSSHWVPIGRLWRVDDGHRACAAAALQWIIDRVLVLRHYHELTWLALAVVAVALLRGVFQYARAYLGHVFGSNSVYLLRNRLYQRLQSFSFHLL